MIYFILVWDYDTPTGFDVSYHSRAADPMSEYLCTGRIIELLGAYGIASTFACVGLAATPGDLPYHNPAQIRQLAAAGHEIASHSHRHELLPRLNRRQLLETLQSSKAALEDCIGEEVIGFVPPWNRPFHHPRKGAFSLKDWRAGRWQQSVDRLTDAAGECGYRWLRIHYRSLGEQLAAKFRPGSPIRPMLAEKRGSLFTLRLSYCGYDSALYQWVVNYVTIKAQKDVTLLIYAHPHAIEHSNSQHWHHLTQFVNWYDRNKTEYNLQFITPKEWLARQGSGRD